MSASGGNERCAGRHVDLGTICGPSTAPLASHAGAPATRGRWAIGTAARGDARCELVQRCLAVGVATLRACMDTWTQLYPQGSFAPPATETACRASRVYACTITWPCPQGHRHLRQPGVVGGHRYPGLGWVFSCCTRSQGEVGGGGRRCCGRCGRVRGWVRRLRSLGPFVGPAPAPKA